ncbi:MAG: hypothetical protein RW306_06765 [Geobacteraceae bacterium]|nr:hypothetical protein [Geobacteraceae bacterium]
MPDHGDNFFNELDKLHESQKLSVEFILQEVYQIASEEAQRENRAASSAVYRKEQHFRRPHQVFVIDGKRGSGKTTTLITAYRHLELLGKADGIIDGHKDPRVVTLKRLGVEAEITGRVRRNGALVIPIIMPNELADNESVMENLFAQIEAKLLCIAEKEATVADSRKGRALWENDEPVPHETITAKILIQELLNEIAVGWTYSQRIGLNALVHDSLNYRDYVERRAEQARISYTRVDAWRIFVNKLLDYLNYEVMVISIDDSDLSPHIGEDILHALRMYLCHPRIVTLLAINMEALVEGLERVEFARLYELSRVLTKADKQQELKKIQRDTRRSIHDYVHKILPVERRSRLSAGKVAFDRLFIDKLGKSISVMLANKINSCVKQLAGTKGALHERWQNELIFWNSIASDLRVLYSENIREMLDVITWFKASQSRDSDIFASFIQLRLSQPSMIDCADILHLPLSESLYNSVFDKKLQLVISNGIVYRLPNAALEHDDAQRLFLQFIARCEIALNRLNNPQWLRALISSFVFPVHPAAEYFPLINELTIAGAASLFPNGTSIPRNCLYLDDLSQITRDDYWLTTHATQCNWSELLKNVIDFKRYKDYVKPSDKTDLHVIFKNALFTTPSNENVKINQLTACYVLYHLTGKNNLGPSQLWAYCETLVGSSILKNNSADNLPFLNFVQKAQQFVQRQAYILDAINGIIVNALIVAGMPITDEDKIKKGEGSFDREQRIARLLENVFFMLTAKEQGLRKRTLLAWAVLPYLPHLVTIEGIKNEKIWIQVSNMLAMINNEIKTINKKTERWKEFPEFTDQLLETVIKDISKGVNEFAKTMKVIDTIRAFPDDIDFYSLNYKQQIAYLLNTTVKQAEAFLEHVGRA